MAITLAEVGQMMFELVAAKEKAESQLKETLAKLHEAEDTMAKVKKELEGKT